MDYELPILTCKQCAGDMPKWTWLAGIIDSDGSIYITKEPRPDIRRGFGWRGYMCVTNTNLVFLKTIQHVFNSGLIQVHSKEKTHHKQAYRLRFSPNAMRKLLPNLLPHLIVKKVQGKLMIEVLSLLLQSRAYHTNNDKRLEEIYSDFGGLNGGIHRRGKYDNAGN